MRHAVVPNKTIVGPVENIEVAELGLHFDSRIDTGAKTSSLHAKNIEIENRFGDMQDNIGQEITFTSVNEMGEEVELTTTITSIQQIRNAQGLETRYTVDITLILEGREKLVEVNLRDRSHMQYKLLIGRNWLSKDYLVDVDL